MAIHLARIQRIKDKINSIMAENTGKSVDVIRNACERDNFMSPQEALDFGLIDKVITKR